MTTQTPERLIFDAPATPQRDGATGIPLTFDAPQHASTREVIPAAGARFQVTETPYAFDASRGVFSESANDFSSDVFAAGLGDREAGERALDFVRTQFAVAQSNVQSALPAQRSPIAYVDRREYATPLLSTLSKGPLTNIAPFSFPKFGAVSGLVGPHTEGVEPTPGAFSTTSQLVQPKALSGKAEITREVIDQGGNPQVSGLIFEKMRRGYFEAAEAMIVATLEANAAQVTDISLTTGGVGKALVSDLTGQVADLQYVRGGFAFDLMAVQTDLYRRLATATDDTGRPLLPATGVSNSNGTAGRFWSSLNVNGVEATPCWALAASSASASNSWLIDSSSVHAWLSAPQRLDFNFGASVQSGNVAQVALCTVGIFGYQASAISDLGGVRQITYTR